MQKAKPNYPKIIFKICTIATFAATSLFLVVAGFATQHEMHFGFKESGDIDYKVQLRADNFLGEAELAAGDTYLASLIDKISAEYKYGASFTEPVTGDYEYKFVATIGADRENGEKYWTRTYDLAETKYATVEDVAKLNISERIEVDYVKYAQLLEDFRGEYDLAARGSLKVEMQIAGEFTTEIMDRPAVLNSNIELDVPLTEESINLTVSTDTDNNGKLYTRKYNIETDAHRFSRFAGLMLAVATAYLILKAIVDAVISRRAHCYEYTVEKLREEYDNIIVDIEKAPKVAGLNVSTVKSFDELLDVYNSIQMPINFYEEKGESHFLLISEKLAWQFVLRENDFIEKPAKNKPAKTAKRKSAKRRARK